MTGGGFLGLILISMGWLFFLAGLAFNYRAKAAIPVNKIAEAFGGGGHAYAAGCTVKAPSAVAARVPLAVQMRKAIRAFAGSGGRAARAR